MKILFLDIDGVLNNHEFNAISESNTILPRCVKQLNRIIHHTGTKVVLSSAWRYMILGEVMTLMGFRHMLQTHGVTKELDIIGVTDADLTILPLAKDRRASQINRYLMGTHATTFVILDDGYRNRDGTYDDFGIPEMFPLNSVMTNGEIGLTREDADKAIQILLRSGI